MVSRNNALERGITDDPVGTIDWEAVYRLEMPRIYNFFRYRTGDNSTAEDLTATTFEKAWRGRSRYRRDLAAFSTWLFTIARRVATDHLRRKGSPSLSLDDLDELTDQCVGPEAAAERREAFQRLTTLLHALPSREAELIALKYGGGLTNRAIAQLTGLSESNVGTILHRTVQRLKQTWEMSS